MAMFNVTNDKIATSMPNVHGYIGRIEIAMPRDRHSRPAIDS